MKKFWLKSIKILAVCVLIFGLAVSFPGVQPSLAEPGVRADRLQQNIGPERSTGVNTTTSYYAMDGWGFNPATNGYAFSVSADFCVNPSNEGPWLGSVSLPHGATIIGMYFNYINETTSPLVSDVRLFRRSYSGTLTIIIDVMAQETTAGPHSDYGTADSILALVDNLNNTYGILWYGRGTGQSLCGINIVYTVPSPFVTSLPFLMR